MERKIKRQGENKAMRGKGDEKRKEGVMRREMASIMGKEQREAVLTRTVFVLLNAAGNSVIKPGKTEPYTTSQPHNPFLRGPR